MMKIQLENRNEETVRIYYERVQDSEIKELLPQKAQTVEEAIEDYKETLYPDAKSYGRIILAEGRYIGDVWCYGITKTERPNAMLSFCIFEKEFWSKGIASIAVNLFLEEIQKKYGFKTVGAFAYLENTASIRVLKNNGFIVKEMFAEERKESAYLEYDYFKNC